jgi:hypothetical protein
MALPLEIIESIIGCLKDDHRALCACSCVCRNWSSYSQHLIFQLVSITRPHLTHRLGTTLSHSPHLVNYIRVVQLRTLSPNLQELPVLPNVHTLSLQQYWLEQGGKLNIFLRHLSFVFPNVSSLIVTGTFDKVHTMIALIQSLPNARHLELSWVAFDNEPVFIHQPPEDGGHSEICTLRLESIAFLNCQGACEKLCEWFQGGSFSDVKWLRSIDFTWDSVNRHPDRFAALLKSACRQLRRISVHLNGTGVLSKGSSLH